MIRNLKNVFKKSDTSVREQRMEEILKGIEKLPDDWHGAGMMDTIILKKILKHVKKIEMNCTVETGSGVSTLFFSHLSREHIVFSFDSGNGSLKNVVKSPLFNAENVEIIEGPTQLTLPKYTFDKKIQLALIDGPHGYPFPDLEYYYIYPNLEPGSILIIDDIHIKTINNMFHFIKEDKMFDLLEIDRNKTAFFVRTDEDTFPPTIDGWWKQNYNKDLLKSID